jgi:hypothetical protein
LAQIFWEIFRFGLNGCLALLASDRKLASSLVLAFVFEISPIALALSIFGPEGQMTFETTPIYKLAAATFRMGYQSKDR